MTTFTAHRNDNEITVYMHDGRCGWPTAKRLARQMLGSGEKLTMLGRSVTHGEYRFRAVPDESDLYAAAQAVSEAWGRYVDDNNVDPMSAAIERLRTALRKDNRAHSKA